MRLCFILKGIFKKILIGNLVVKVLEVIRFFRLRVIYLILFVIYVVLGYYLGLMNWSNYCFDVMSKIFNLLFVDDGIY